MAGSKKRSRQRAAANRKAKNVGDVTINDFANSPSASRGRLKKASSSVEHEVKRELVKAENGGVETGEVENERIGGSNAASEGKTGSGSKATFKNRRKKGEEVEEGGDGSKCEATGIDYPIDLWFLISEKISPESIGKFARICRSSYHVVQTATFWFHLYKRYYTPVAGLPERLQPECMSRCYGLRACVIRALHYVYFPLLQAGPERIPRSLLRHEEPHSLVKRMCCLMWNKMGKERWYYFFKLKEPPKNCSISSRRVENRKQDFIEMLQDVSANPEEGCRILRVTCLKYGLVAPVIGLTLKNVLVNLSPGFEHHRLQLGFGTPYIPRAISQVVTLSGVVDIQILDWWHPRYPHQDSILPPLLTGDAWD